VAVEEGVEDVAASATSEQFAANDSVGVGGADVSASADVSAGGAASASAVVEGGSAPDGHGNSSADGVVNGAILQSNSHYLILEKNRSNSSNIWKLHPTNASKETGLMTVFSVFLYALPFDAGCVLSSVKKNSPVVVVIL
jgi:hypothetical protein